MRDAYGRLIFRPSRRFFQGVNGLPCTLRVTLRLLSRSAKRPKPDETNEDYRGGGLRELVSNHFAFVINLQARKDRRFQFGREFSRLIGAQPLRFSAIRKKNGHLGCSMSHLEVLKRAKAEGLPFVAVFEDDIEFIGNSESLDLGISTFLQDGRIDVLLFTHRTRSFLPRLRSGLRLVTGSLTTAGYLAKNRAFGDLIAVAETSSVMLQQGVVPEKAAIDVLWQELQCKSLIFVTFEARLARQRASWSDIEGAFKDRGL